MRLRYGSLEGGRWIIDAWVDAGQLSCGLPIPANHRSLGISTQLRRLLMALCLSIRLSVTHH